MSKDNFQSNFERNLITSSPLNLTPNPSELCPSHLTGQLSPMNDQSPIIITTTTTTTTTTTATNPTSCTCTFNPPLLNPCISVNSYQAPTSDLIPNLHTINHIQNHDHANNQLPLNHLTTTPWSFNPSANNLSHHLNVHQPSHFNFLGNDNSRNFLPYQFQITPQPPPPLIPPNPHLIPNHQLQETSQNVNHLKRPRSRSKLDTLSSSKPAKLTRIECYPKPEEAAKSSFSNKNQTDYLGHHIPNRIQPRDFLNEFEIASSPESHTFEVQSNHHLDPSISPSPIQSGSKLLVQNQPKSGQWKRKMTEKRREQNRTHQRAYRERRDVALKQKDDEIAGLKNEINNLKNRNGNQDKSIPSHHSEPTRSRPSQNMTPSTSTSTSNQRFLPFNQLTSLQRPPSTYPNQSSEYLNLPQISNRTQPLPLRVGGGNPQSSTSSHRQNQPSIPSSSSQPFSNNLHQSRLPSTPTPNTNPADISD